MSRKIKRNFKLILSIAIVFLLCIIPVKLRTLADINGAESQVIGAACSTFYYDGEYYQADPAYVNQLINALDSQYDLTQAQANICVDYIYNNVGYAIEAGYLVKIEVSEGTQEGNQDNSNGSGETNNPTGDSEVGDQESPSGNGAYYADNNIVEIDKDQTSKSKEEAIKEATDFAEDMGVIIKFDNGKDGITITDKSGNVLISTREAVKNTGFRFNTIVVFAVSLVTSVIVMIIVAGKLRLLEGKNSYEEAE